MSNANSLIGQHNTATSDFTKRQDDPCVAIRKHYLAEGSANYSALQAEYDNALPAAEKIDQDNTELDKKIRDLNAKVKSHGPAAQQINKLIHAYPRHRRTGCCQA